MGRLASAFAHLRWTILVVVAAACQQGWLPHLPDADVVEPAEIKPSSDTVAIPPGGSHRLGFQLLTAQKTPVPDAVINFTILDNKDTPGSGGAKLSMSSGLTDEQGWVVLQIIAGAGSDGQKPLSFWLQAAAGEVTAKLPIFITQGRMASAEIMPETEKAWDGEDAVASTSLYFYDDTVCADVSWEHPPPNIRGERRLPPEVRSMEFTNIVTSGVHAVLAVATGTRGKIVAKGCAELPGNSLSPDQLMRLILPLARIHISPLGTYSIQARYPLTQHPKIVPIRKQWQDLTTRPCDPASLWLDCTIDALNGESPADPLDCQPMAGEEGELGALLTARRAVSGGKTCTGQQDAKGKLSLDTKTYMLFPSGFLTGLLLTKLPDEVNATLAELSVQSTLTIKESDSLNVLDMEHALNTLTLSVSGVPVTASVVDLGLPVWDVWFPSAQSPGQLTVGMHGFTLRLGSFARWVYTKSSQAFSRSGTADVGAFVSYLFNGALRNSRATPQKGCDALDSLLCEEAGQDPGCIMTACQAGLRALTNRLDSSFSVLDGPSLDFSLSGYAQQLSDPDGDGKANALNFGFLNAVFNGQMPSTVSWSAQLIAPSSP